MIPVVLAEQKSLGIFKKGECIQLIENCADCSYVNLTSIVFPNSTFLFVGNTEMTKADTVYNYTMCNTNVTGDYMYCVKGDPEGIVMVDCVSFEINDRGVGIRDNTSNIAIIIVLLVIILLGSFFTYYMESGLKFAFFLGTVLTTVFTMNLIANIAADSGASLNVVNLLWFGYSTGLYIFWGLFLFVLYKLTVGLKIQKNPPPTMGSPLKIKRQERLKRQGRVQ